MATRGERILKVTIVGDATKAERAFGSVSEAAGQTETKVSSVSKKIGGALAGLAIGRALHGTSQDFAKFQDLTSGAASAVGASIEEMDRVAKSFRFVPPSVAAEGLRDLLQISKGYGQSGEEAKAAAKKQLDWAEPASVVTGLPVESVVEGIAGAYRGEYDALQKVIPTINAANVEQEALRMTGKKHAKDLTDLDRAMAVQNIILQDQSGYLQQLGENADTQAAKQKEATAATEKARIELGEKMAPVMKRASELAAGLATAFANLPGPVQTATVGLAGLAVVAGVLAPAIGAVSGALAFLAAHPVVLAVAALAALVGGLVYGYKNSETFRDIVNGVIDAVSEHWRAFALAFAGPVGVIGSHWDTIKSVAEAGWTFIRDRVDSILNHWRTFATLFGGPVGIVAAHWDTIKSIFSGGVRFIGNIIANVLRVAATVADAVSADKLAGSLRGAADRVSRWGEDTGMRSSPTGGSTFGLARGGPIPGVGDRDSVPAMLTPGEFVVRKDVVKRLGPDWLEYLNKTGEPPGFQLGGIVTAGPGEIRTAKGARELFERLVKTWPVMDLHGALLRDIPPAAVNAMRAGVLDFLRIKSDKAAPELTGAIGGGGGNIVAVGRQIQAMGYRVGEHPAFGGVAPVHVRNSYHYRGRAIDVNWPGAGRRPSSTNSTGGYGPTSGPSRSCCGEPKATTATSIWP